MSVQFMAIIREHTFDPATVTEKMWTDTMAAHAAFADAVAAAGGSVLFTGGLQADNAVHIRPSTHGRPAIFTDGPFAESKEVNHGFYLIELPDDTQAHHLAALIPTGGSVELYPVMHGSSYPATV